MSCDANWTGRNDARVSCEERCCTVRAREWGAMESSCDRLSVVVRCVTRAQSVHCRARAIE